MIPDSIVSSRQKVQDSQFQNSCPGSLLPVQADGTDNYIKKISSHDGIVRETKYKEEQWHFEHLSLANEVGGCWRLHVILELGAETISLSGPWTRNCYIGFSTH